MSIFAGWLLGLALGDLVRGSTGDRWPRLSGVSGFLAVVLGAVALGASTALEVGLVVGAALSVPLWQCLSAAALRSNGHPAGPLALIAAIAAVLLLSGVGPRLSADSPLGWWLGRVQEDPWPGGRALLVTAVLLANLSTGNMVVRLVLTIVGALRPASPGAEPQPSDRIRGGRLLGAMERLLIVGLGLAGEVTAAGLVIAAKGLMRFPELQASRDDATTVSGVGIDDITEYFLVGSFVSWLFALGGLALLR